MLTQKLFGLAAIVPTVLLGGAAMASATSGNATSKGCSVSVDRTQPAGTFNVTRQMMRNGNCVCYIYAGPSGSGADKAIAGVAQSGRCGNAAGLASAEAAQDAGAAPMDAAPASGGGLSATTVGVGLVAVAAVAGGVIAATKDDDSSGG